MIDKRTAALALLATPGAGAQTVRLALDAARDTDTEPGAWFGLRPEDLAGRLPTGLHSALLDPLCRCDDALVRRAQFHCERLAEAGAAVILITDDDYPGHLRSVLGKSAPPILCCVGDLERLHDAAAAVVGARQVSRRGAILAAECAKVWTEAGITVVSGGAEGVDQAAHYAAIEQGGRTVVVLPQGMLTFRMPPALSDAIDEGRAAVVSEFVPDLPWATHAAVTRNATISALARVVCVIEPRKRGGSVRTARHALHQGKPALVYCAPGDESIFGELCRAGATPLLDSDGQFRGSRLANAFANAISPTSQAELF